MNPFVTVSEAIKYAGGFEEYASLRNVEVITSDGNKILGLIFINF